MKIGEGVGEKNKASLCLPPDGSPPSPPLHAPSKPTRFAIILTCVHRQRQLICYIGLVFGNQGEPAGRVVSSPTPPLIALTPSLRQFAACFFNSKPTHARPACGRELCGQAGQVRKGLGRLTFRRALGSVTKTTSRLHTTTLADAGVWAAGAAWKGAGSTPQEAVGARGGAWPAWPAPFSVERPWRPRVGSGFDAPKRRDLAWAGETREFDQLCL